MKIANEYSPDPNSRKADVYLDEFECFDEVQGDNRWHEVELYKSDEFTWEARLDGRWTSTNTHDGIRFDFATVPLESILESHVDPA